MNDDGDWFGEYRHYVIVKIHFVHVFKIEPSEYFTMFNVYCTLSQIKHSILGRNLPARHELDYLPQI